MTSRLPIAERVVYIAGYGRSGSTVLGTLLGAHPNAEHVGELSFLFEELGLGRTCSCGCAYSECVFWKPVVAGRIGQWSQYARLTRKIESARGLPRLLTDGAMIHEASKYSSVHSSLLSDIRARAGVEVLVDSSKSAWATVGRSLALSRLAVEPVYIVHLIRSGRATMDSLLKTGSNWELEGRVAHQPVPAARAAFGWTAVNYLTRRLAAELPQGRYLAVRYEDLVARPASTLSRVARFVDLDLSSVIESISRREEFGVGHVTGGNRLRFQSTIRLHPGAVSAEPLADRRRDLLFSAIGGWLEREYGYR